MKNYRGHPTHWLISTQVSSRGRTRPFPRRLMRPGRRRRWTADDLSGLSAKDGFLEERRRRLRPMKKKEERRSV